MDTTLPPSLFIAATAAGTFCLLTGAAMAVLGSPRRSCCGGGGGGGKASSVRRGRGDDRSLVVTAHPDDESLFFLPAAFVLANSGIDENEGHAVHLLCFSTGDYQCRGRARCRELRHCCNCVLGIDSRIYLRVVNHPALQDGPGAVWDTAAAARCIEQYLCDIATFEYARPNCNAQGSALCWQVINFDDLGASGHPNHTASHDAAALFDCMHAWLRRDRACFCGAITRFYEVGSALASQIFWGASSFVRRLLKGEHFPCAAANPDAVGVIKGNIITGALAMATHKTQWVWYRKLQSLATSASPLFFTRRMPTSDVERNGP